MGNWWKKEQNKELIEQFYYAQFSGDSQSLLIRNEIFRKLYPTLEYIGRLALHHHKMEQTPNNIQECILKQWFVLNKIQLDKIDAVQNLLYISTKNWLGTLRRQQGRKIFQYENLEEIDIIDEDDLYDVYEQEEKRLRIIDELDRRIDEQKEIDRKSPRKSTPISTRTLFLTEMKKYIEENSYDVSAFNNYVMNKLNISPSTYSILMKEFNITTKPFNEKLVNYDKED